MTVTPHPNQPYVLKLIVGTDCLARYPLFTGQTFVVIRSLERDLNTFKLKNAEKKSYVPDSTLSIITSWRSLLNNTVCFAHIVR